MTFHPDAWVTVIEDIFKITAGSFPLGVFFLFGAVWREFERNPEMEGPFRFVFCLSIIGLITQICLVGR